MEIAAFPSDRFFGSFFMPGRPKCLARTPTAMASTVPCPTPRAIPSATVRTEALPIARIFALTFQKKRCRPSQWPRRTDADALGGQRPARRVAVPLHELGSKHAEVRAPAQAQFL